jgi:hypothetical protein
MSDKIEYNIITNETTESNYSAAELKVRATKSAELKVIADERQAKAEADAIAKAALLARLGITDDEAKLLLG